MNFCCRFDRSMYNNLMTSRMSDSDQFLIEANKFLPLPFYFRESTKVAVVSKLNIA